MYIVQAPHCKSTKDLWRLLKALTSQETGKSPQKQTSTVKPKHKLQMITSSLLQNHKTICINTHNNTNIIANKNTKQTTSNAQGSNSRQPLSKSHIRSPFGPDRNIKKNKKTTSFTRITRTKTKTRRRTTRTTITISTTRTTRTISTTRTRRTTSTRQTPKKQETTTSTIHFHPDNPKTTIPRQTEAPTRRAFGRQRCLGGEVERGLVKWVKSLRCSFVDVFCFFVFSIF